MTELQRHQWTFRILLPFCHLFAKWKFNYSFDDLSRIDGPYLLLPNHNLELDPIVVGLAAGKQIYFVASEHLTRKGFATKLLNYFFHPIIHQKGRLGIRSTAQILKTLRSGSSICLFPEGNRSFNGLTGAIPPATGKLARKSGVKLVTYRFEGAYLTNPRWSLSLRRGKLRGRLIHVYTPEELSAMTDTQINEAIRRDLYEDAYATQHREMVSFKGKNLALGIESTLFACPNCHQIGTLHSSGNSISCRCGFHAIYNTYGFLTDNNRKNYTVTQLDSQQRTLLRQLITATVPDQPLFSDSVTLQTIGDDHTLLKEETGSLAAYVDHLVCCDHTVNYCDILGMAIYSRNVLILHTDSGSKHFEIRGSQMFSALKYLYLFEITKEEQ